MTQPQRPINLRLPPRQLELLDELVEYGLYGASRAEVIRTLITRGLVEAARQGAIEIRRQH